MFDRWLKNFSRKTLPSFTETHILRDSVSTTRDEALQFIAEQMMQAGYVHSAESFLQDLIARESKSTTGFKDQIATPHAKSREVLNAGIWVVQFTHDIPWETMDERPVRTAVALAIPAKSDEAGMLPLIAISRANMKAEFRATLLQPDHQAINAAIATAIGGTV